ncbi:MAG: hypothetical protein MI922_10570 [Bacteroidales bacterium]|nr:hypothetical protein [Bacteroidales bacterium]
MPFKATLYLDDTQRSILNANYVIRQGMDLYQRPNAFPHGGYISIRLEITGDEDTLWEWAVSPTMMRNGKIRFFRRNGQSRMADLEFWDAYCIDLSESFSAYSSKAMTLQLILSPGIVRFRHAVFEKHWKVTDLSLVGTTGTAYTQEEEVNEVVQEEEPPLEPKLHGIHFESMDGKIWSKWVELGEFILYIKSENATGKTISMSLDFPDRILEYNGDELVDNKLENLEITSDEMKLTLNAKLKPKKL